MSDDLRALLTEVAAGRIAPDRAAQLLDDLPAAGPAAGPAAQAGAAEPPARPATPPAVETPAVHRIRVVASARPVRIIGDHGVDTLAVDGPHTVHRDGDVVRVEAATNQGTGGYAYERKTGLSKWLAQAGSVGVPLTVRMNPALAVDAEVMAGSLEIVGLAGPVGFSLTAGSLRLRDCSGPLTGVVRAGSAVLQVRPTAGASSVRVESGSVDLKLMPGSDVRVNGRADLGEFKVRSADGALTSQKSDVLAEVVGAGTATFDLQLAMGSAKVRLP